MPKRRINAIGRPWDASTHTHTPTGARSRMTETDTALGGGYIM